MMSQKHLKIYLTELADPFVEPAIVLLFASAFQSFFPCKVLISTNLDIYHRGCRKFVICGKSGGCRRPMAHASFFAIGLPNASVETFDLLIFLCTRQNCGNTQKKHMEQGGVLGVENNCVNTQKFSMVCSTHFHFTTCNYVLRNATSVSGGGP